MHLSTNYQPINDSTFSGQSSDSLTLPVYRQERVNPVVDSQTGNSPRQLNTNTVITVQKKQISNTQQEEMDTVVPVISKQQRGTTSGIYNFLTDNQLKEVGESLNQSISKGNLLSTANVGKPSAFDVTERTKTNNDWLFGIFLFLTLLFIWVKVFYGKFFFTLASSIKSYQISVKLYREKNVLTQRVSILMNFIYLITLSIFIFQLSAYFHLLEKQFTPFRLFLVSFNLVILYALGRMFVLYSTGFIFQAQGVISEYTHSTYVINKGLGILLFPIVIMFQYFPVEVLPVIIILGSVCIITGIFFKVIRAYQIINRREVLIFYLILYLCTLEILPFLLGYKLATSLIQSN